MLSKLFKMNDNDSEQESNLYAAIDLGSNSFHLIIIREQNEQIQIVDRHKEMIRLRSGLDEAGNLTDTAFNSGIACLERFGQLLKNIPPQQVRAVGTNTLRNAKNSQAFLEQGQQVLGHDIQIISGEEEARLIFLGVSHGQPNTHKQQLIMDIGGGSTEFIIGKDFEHKHLTSTEMGCVSITQQFFKDGIVSEANTLSAILYCRRILRPYYLQLINQGWDEAIGASGSIKAIGHMLKENNLTEGGITLEGLQAIRRLIVQNGSINKAIENGLKGLSEERTPVFAGGLAILSAAFYELKIKEMNVSNSALREGLIYDTLGRLKQEDVREASVDRFQKWLKIDELQAERVQQTARQFLSESRKTLSLSSKVVSFPRILTWAAKLHESGMSLNYKRYRYHSAYLVKNAELSGFSQQDHESLAAIVLNHRAKFDTSAFSHIADNKQANFIDLTLLLRLAVVLHRGREDERLAVKLSIKEGNHFRLTFSPEWIENHPLTCEDLKSEAKQFKALGRELSFRAKT